MANPFHPTKRVLFLLERIRLGLYTGCRYLPPRPHRYYRDMRAVYASGIRNASEQEILHLLTFDMIEEVPTPGNHDTYDTTNPDKPVLTGEGMKLRLRSLGLKLLEGKIT